MVRQIIHLVGVLRHVGQFLMWAFSVGMIVVDPIIRVAAMADNPGFRWTSIYVWQRDESVLRQRFHCRQVFAIKTIRIAKWIAIGMASTKTISKTE